MSRAVALDGPRDSHVTKQSLLDFVCARVSGILAEYEVWNDRDTGRAAPTSPAPR